MKVPMHHSSAPSYKEELRAKFNEAKVGKL
jgi:hypothetical protein